MPASVGEERGAGKTGRAIVEKLSRLAEPHCERSEAIQGTQSAAATGLLRRFAPRDDG